MDHVFMVSDHNTAQCEAGYTGCQIAAAEASPEASTYEAYRLRGTNPFLITDYVCTGSAGNVQAMSIYSSCDQEITSYLTVLNPFPCATIPLIKVYQALVAGGLELGIHTMGFDKYVATLDFDDLAFTLFNVFEDYSSCVDSWATSLTFHFVKAMLEFPEMLGIAWSFTWLHSVYGMYPLCAVANDDGTLMDQGNIDGETYNTHYCNADAVNECYDECAAETGSGGGAYYAPMNDPTCITDCLSACPEL
jgi:hypothetical protein